MRVLVGTALILFALPAPAQVAPVPDVQQLTAARAGVFEEVLELLVEAKGKAEAVRMLVRRARTKKDKALAYVLLSRARSLAVQNGDLAEAVAVVDEIVGRFAVDEFAILDETLRGLAPANSTSKQALAFAFLDLASRAVRHADANRSAERVKGALAAAKNAAAAGGDMVLSGYVKAVQRELAVRGEAYRSLVVESSKPQLGRYLCWFEGKWTGGLPLLSPENSLERRILRSKGIVAGAASAAGAGPAAGADPVVAGAPTPKAFETCISIAESWLSRSKSYDTGDAAAQRLMRRNLTKHALSWYYQAWPSSSGVERTRLIRRMGQLEDKLFADGVSAGILGQMSFAAEGRSQLLIKGGAAKVDKGRLVLTNHGPAMSATCRYAFRNIRSVTIRGGIRSPKNLNFRFAVGRFNAICNWEVRPENHFFFGNVRIHGKPPLFQPGREHVIRLRQMGERVVFFFDDEPVFEAEGRLVGAGSETVSVYASLGSEVFVREIFIDGDVDPYTTVTQPLRKLW